MSPILESDFTAAEIAGALDITPQRVRQFLAGIEPDGARTVSGQSARTWSFARLPELLRERLAARAQAAGYDGPERLFSVRPWQPPVPFGKCSPAAQDKARKRMAALATVLPMWAEPTRTLAEKMIIAKRDYESVFGDTIHEDSLKNLIDRVFNRAGPARDFSREEIYLDENPERQVVVQPDEAERPEFDGIVAAIPLGREPSPKEAALLWAATMRAFHDLSSTEPPRRVRRELLQLLWTKVQGIAATKEALRKRFAYRVKFGDKAVEQFDRRRAKKGQHRAHTLTEGEKNYLAGDIATKRGNRVRSGMREHAGVDRSTLPKPEDGQDLVTLPSQATLDSLKTKSRSKYYQKRRIASELKRRVDNMKNYHRGNDDDEVANLVRDSSKLRPMQVVSADDFTWPVYFIAEDGPGKRILTRGQCLIFADCRSLKILGYSLQPDRNYDQFVIRTLDNKVSRQWGVPKVKYYERGIWMRSKLVNNAAPVGWQANSWEDCQFGWERLGVRMINATRASAKPVEGIGRMVQALMEPTPGYCGRNEREDCPETTRRNILAFHAGREPEGTFLTFAQWHLALGGIIERYNATVQQGRTLVNLSPDQAFEKFWPYDDPPTQATGDHWHLFAHYVSKRKVTKDGIQFKLGKETFIYRDEHSAPFIGEEVLAWFDPESPELLGITDLDSKRPALVQRHNPVDFLAALEPESPAGQAYRDEVSKATAHNKLRRAVFKIVSRTFEPKLRIPIVSPEVREVAQAFGKRQEKAERKQQLNARANRAARELGCQLPPDASPSQIDATEKMNRIFREHDL